MYIGYMINDRGDMLFKIEDKKENLNVCVQTVYTWPLDLKTNSLPLVSFKGEDRIIKGKGISHDVVDTMYSPSYHGDAGQGWTKFGDPWFIALSNNKGYENKTLAKTQEKQLHNANLVKGNSYTKKYLIV